MKQAIKLVGLDLDGTLLGSDHRISLRNKQAIERANTAGCMVIPATGRPLRGVPAEFLAIPGVDWAVTANGATVVDRTGVHPPLHFWIPTQHWFRVREMTAGMDCVLDLFVDGCAYNNASFLEEAEEWAPPGMADYMRQSRRSVPDIVDFARRLPEIEKANLFFRKQEERQRARELLEQSGLFAVTSSASNNLELNAAGVHKGRALLALAELLGLEKTQVMACGDSNNDWEMLRTVGVGVAMGNADDETKALADWVTETNDRDGVAMALERFVLRCCPEES